MFVRFDEAPEDHVSFVSGLDFARYSYLQSSTMVTLSKGSADVACFLSLTL